MICKPLREIDQDTGSFFSQSLNKLTDSDTRFKVSSVLSLPHVSVAVIWKLLSNIKKLIRLLSNLGACTGLTQVHPIAQDTGSIFKSCKLKNRY